MNRTELEQDHDHKAVEARLKAGPKPSYIADAILGGMDGCVTTFAIVSGSIGAGFGGVVAVVLGIANLLADGFSMAVSNYEANRAEQERRQSLRDTEAAHIAQVPEGEREEIRQIFRAKGFDGDMLETVVETITSDERVWLDTMMTEEHGIGTAEPRPLASAAATMAAFITVGAVPLTPFLVPGLGPDATFATSAGLAATMFMAVGALKSRNLGQPRLRGGIRTLLTGSAAATIAYAVGALLQAWIGAA